MSWFYNEKEKSNFYKFVSFLALLIFVWGAFVLNPTENRKDYSACVNQATEIQKYQTAHIIDIIESGAELSNDQKKDKADADSQYLENRATCNDLKAQWSMAVIAYIGLLAGLMGLLAVIGTLWQTSKAAKAAIYTLDEAGKATDAAKDSVKVTREMGAAQTRAYVHVEEAQFIRARGKHALKTKLTVTNTGQTPAKWFEIAAKSKPLTAKEAWSELDFSEVTEFVRWPSLANGSRLKPDAGAIGESQHIKTAQLHNPIFLVYGIVRYETVFGEVYETQFAFQHQNPASGLFLNRPPIKLQTYRMIDIKKNQTQ